MARDDTTIKLDQFLKFKNIAASGGDAKQMVRAGLVRVNGEVETRRGRKLRSGDTVEVDDRTLIVELGAAPPAGAAGRETPPATRA